MSEGKTIAEEMLKATTDKKIDSMLDSESEVVNDNAQITNSAIENSVINHGSIVINGATEQDKVERKTSHNKRSTDKFISVAQAAELKDMVVKIEAMEAQRNNGKQAKAIWTGLSDHCNVPHSKSATPRYQLICESQFYQAMSYLLAWKNQLLKLQLVELEKAQITPQEDKHWLEKLASLIVNK